MRKSFALFFIVAFGSLALAVGYAWANAGALDLSWGDGGVSYAGSEEADDFAFSQVMLSDGSLIAGGWANAYPGDFGAARFLPEGHLDPDFGDDGMVTTAFTDDPEAVDAAYGINSRPDGGFHLFGETCDLNYENCQFAVAAYLADGSLDESFDEDGRVVTDPGTPEALSWSTRNILQPDGKLVTAGVVFQEDGDVDIILLRYNTDGSLDDEFGGDGMVIQDFTGIEDYPQDILALPGDKILVSGSSAELADDGMNYLPSDAFLALFESDGDLDPTFGGGAGYIMWNHNGEATTGQRAIIHPDGNLLLLGAIFLDGLPADCTLQKFDMEGNLDTSFGDEGWVIIDSGQNDYCWDIKVTPDDKLVFAGEAAPPPPPDLRGIPANSARAGRDRMRGLAMNRMAVATRQADAYDNIIGRYKLDGTPDASFGENGLTRFLVPESGRIYGVDIQWNGKYVVAGEALTGEQIDIVALRFLGEERPKPERIDPTWGDEGISFAVFGGGDEQGYAQLIQPDDKVIVSGWADIWPGDFGAARFLPDGGLDTDFGDGGRVTTAFTDDPTLVDASYGISGRSNGGFFLFGETCDADYFICQLAVAAYLADGTLDESFGEDGKVVTDPGGDSSLSWPNRILTQADGGLIAAGVVYQESGDVDIVLVKYKANGDLDESFGDGGIAIQDFNEVENYPQDMLQLPDGKILLAGGFSELADDEINYEPSDAFLARFTSEGELDTTFGGGDGFVTWDYGDDLGALGQRAFLHPDGGLLVLGASFSEADPGDCTLQRFDMDGTMDMTYGDEGWVTIDSGHDDFCWDMELTDDRMVVFTGWATHPADPEARAAAGDPARTGRGLMRGPASVANRLASTDNSFDNLLGRYHLDGQPDATFGGDGLIGFRVNEARAYIHGIDIQSNGNYVVSGDAMTGPYYDFVALRFLGYGPVVQYFMPIVRR